MREELFLIGTFMIQKIKLTPQKKKTQYLKPKIQQLSTISSDLLLHKLTEAKDSNIIMIMSYSKVSINTCPK